FLLNRCNRVNRFNSFETHIINRGVFFSNFNLCVEKKSCCAERFEIVLNDRLANGLSEIWAKIMLFFGYDKDLNN
ncbi:hypothetical protein BpHYR1_048823, partial [Brachionus plicatilis]